MLLVGGEAQLGGGAALISNLLKDLFILHDSQDATNWSYDNLLILDFTMHNYFVNLKFKTFNLYLKSNLMAI